MPLRATKMISILIPIYNFDCRELIEALHKQIVALGNGCEIVVVDDASTVCRDAIAEISKLPYVKFFQFKENQGRSKSRNFLASKAEHRYLLFIDCDAEVCSDKYLQNYVDILKPGICCSGGRALYNRVYGDEYSLSVMYNREVEVNYTKNKTFISFNFIIDKELFNKIRFNEKIIGYGHEDTIFALEVAKHSTISFIDNGLVHREIISNEEYLQKVEVSCQKICKVQDLISESEMKQAFKVWRAYTVLKSVGLSGAMAKWYKKRRGSVKKRLFSKNSKLFWLQIYKLGYLCNIMQNR